MPPSELPPELTRHLNAILHVELAAVQQHFIHILMLKAWGDDETADGIAAIDDVDLPNAMRIIDIMVAARGVPAPRADRAALSVHMPVPGSSHAEIFDAERRLETRMIEALQAADGAVSALPANDIAHLVSDPLTARASYGQWIEEEVAAGPRRSEPSRPLAAHGKASLDALFAHLMVVIEQGLIHSFVHWHGGRKDLADAAWEISGAAMMLATDMTNRLAARRVAPSPAAAVLSSAVPPPRAGRTSDEAVMLDRALAKQCGGVADRAARDLAGTEFETVCRDSAACFKSLSGQPAGTDVPKINNPCIGFERVLWQFVWTGKSAA